MVKREDRPRDSTKGIAHLPRDERPADEEHHVDEQRHSANVVIAVVLKERP
jgi:hypothetical protein